MGYEIAEQLNWELPDVILYPAGGGTGLIGIWKAFYEMKKMKWLDGSFPKMIAVQTETIQPVVSEFHQKPITGKDNGEFTVANGLAVPNPFALKLMVQVLRESKGTAVAVSDQEIKDSIKELSREEGLLVAPEGASLLPALKKLLSKGDIKQDEKVLMLNTGAVYKYLENL